MASGIISTGSWAPPNVVTNYHIQQWTGAPVELIRERTGIEERRYAPDSMATSDLAFEAVSEMLRREEVSVERVRAVIVATSTPDHPQPATASILLAKLGMCGIPAFDIAAACSGFVYALSVGVALLSCCYEMDCVLVVGADTYSRVMNRRDYRTVSIFGDAAGAVAISRVPHGFGIVASCLFGEGRGWDDVIVGAGGSRAPATVERIARGEHFFRMNGRNTREYALHAVPEVIRRTLEKAGISATMVDRFIVHQANVRLIEALRNKLGIDDGDERRCPTTAMYFGNTAAASIPFTLDASHRAHAFQRGERVMLAAVGGGYSAGAVLFKWY